MSDSKTHADLDVLRRSEAPLPTRRRWMPRLVAILLVAGLLGAAYAVLRPVLFPPRTVAVAAVRPAGTEAGAPARSSFVQAAGWIEADPFPTTVRPLVKGVVERLDVIEGTRVEKDVTVIAVLRNVEFENELTLAEARHVLAEAERSHRVTRLAVATSLLEQKIGLRSTLAQRKGELATARADVDRANARRMVAEAALERASVDLNAQRALEEAGHATPTAMAVAVASVNEAEEHVKAARFDEVRMVAELARLTDLLELAREAVDDPRGLQGKVDDARSELERAAAEVARVAAEVSVARRNVALLTIKAPVSGVVMRLESAPGALVGPAGEFKGSGEGAGSTGLLNRLTGTLCSIYDPAHLQARVDVPYADLPGITSGTEVELEAKALPGAKIRGVVSRLVREADITQAKLQVKVRIIEPDSRLRPEMLCTARFLVKAGKQPTPGNATSKEARLLVPTAALRGEAVFVFDPTAGGRARRVAVRVVRADGAWTEVEGALGLSSKLILDDVEDGEAVKEAR